EHFHGVVDERGKPFNLPRRHFKKSAERPRCRKCQEPMRLAGSKGDRVRFACGNPQCSLRGRTWRYRRTETGQQERSTSRGRQRRPVPPDDTCPECKTQGQLDWCGFAKPSQAYPAANIPKIKCRNCKSAYRLKGGTLERMAAAGFQPKPEGA